MFHIFFEEPVDDTQGVFIGSGVEIEGAPQKMPGRIRDKELFGGSRIPAYVEENTADAIGRPHRGVFDGSRFVGMLECHFVRIFLQLVEAVGIGAYLLVADIDPGVEAGEVDIDPVGVLGSFLEKARIAEDPGINGVFKRIREAGLVKGPVLMLGEIDLEIAPGPGGIPIVTGNCGQQAEGQEERRGDFGIFGF